MKSSERGFTLIEVLIAAVILALIAVPVFSLLWTGKSGIDLADKHREARYLGNLILRAAENTDFVELWNNFGDVFDEPGIRSGRLVSTGFGTGNPLRMDEWVLGRIKALGWTVQLRFRFLTRNELGQKKGGLRSKSGVLHLQAGVIWLRLTGSGIKTSTKTSVYCPMILGRPGLDLSQCPAVNPAVRDQGPLAGYP